MLLKFEVDYDGDKLNIIDNATPTPNIVSSWDLAEGRRQLHDQRRRDAGRQNR